MSTEKPDPVTAPDRNCSHEALKWNMDRDSKSLVLNAVLFPFAKWRGRDICLEIDGEWHGWICPSDVPLPTDVNSDSFILNDGDALVLSGKVIAQYEDIYVVMDCGKLLLFDYMERLCTFPADLLGKFFYGKDDSALVSLVSDSAQHKTHDALNRYNLIYKWRVRRIYTMIYRKGAPRQFFREWDAVCSSDLQNLANSTSDGKFTTVVECEMTSRGGSRLCDLI